MTSFLGKSRIIDNQYSLGIGSLCKHPSPIFAKCTVMVPLDFCQQPLHPPFRGVDLLRHRLNRLPVPIHHQPDDITLRQLSGFRSLNVRRINRHVVIYTEKYVLCFHEGCISHPLPFCNIICRSSTNYTNNLQAILVKDKKFKKKRKTYQPVYGYLTSLSWDSALAVYQGYRQRWVIENNAIKELCQYWILEDFHCAKFNAVRAHIMFSVVMFNLHILFKSKYGRRFREKSIAAKRAPGFEPSWVIVYSGDYFGLFDIKEYTNILTIGNKEPP